MKIAHIITRLIVGGAQENTISTAVGLHRKGHSVDLITGPTTGPEGSLENVLAAEGVLILRVPALLREIRPCADIAAFRHLRRILGSGKYDIIHTHSAKAGVLGRIAGRLACPQARIIHTVHGPSFHPYQSFLLNRFYIAVEGFADRFTDDYICVGEVMKQHYLNAGIGNERKYTVIYSGFDLRPYREAETARDSIRERLGIGRHDRVIGMIGRLFHLKGQDHLLSAFSEVVRNVADARLLLVGDGILRESLEEFARRQGILDRVVFSGLAPPETIPEYVSAMDVLAHTSLREGLPRAVAQGFAGGKPVVAFDVDGARELVIEGKTGFLVPAGDRRLLAERLLFLLRNPETARRMATEGRILVESRFAVETMVDRIERLYMRSRGRSRSGR